MCPTMTAAGLGLLVLTSSAWAEPDPVEIVRREGRAYAVDSGKHLYTEHHVERWEAGRHVASEVLYKTPTGRLLSRKQIDYRHGVTAPSFSCTDVRTGSLSASPWTKEGFVLSFREDRSSPLESAKLEDPGRLVIDAGFDHAVLESWKQLLAGTTLKFRFAVPSELDGFTLTLRKTDIVVEDGRRILRLRMEPDSIFVSLFADAVVLDYDLEGTYLRRYVGLSNIKDDEGELRDARIEFGPPRVRKEVASLLRPADGGSR